MSTCQRYEYFEAFNHFNNKFSSGNLCVGSILIKILLRDLFRSLTCDQRNQIVRKIDFQNLRMIETLGWKEISLCDSAKATDISIHYWRELNMAFDECKSKLNSISYRKFVSKKCSPHRF